MKEHKNKIIIILIIIAALAAAFVRGGSVPERDKVKTESYIGEENIKDDKELKDDISEEKKDDAQDTVGNETNTPENDAVKTDTKESTPPDNISERDTDKNEAAPELSGEPIASQNTDVLDRELTCTLSVRCDTILQNISQIAPQKLDIVPKDGIIYEERTVTFYEGESVFNILLREMKKNKIHLEFENTPIYESAYIEGIGNLYEFDCGELSGWMYKVNGSFPNYGCSRYKLKNGDKVEWVYTCDLGKDVGGDYSQGNGR